MSRDLFAALVASEAAVLFLAAKGEACPTDGERGAAVEKDLICRMSKAAHAGFPGLVRVFARCRRCSRPLVVQVRRRRMFLQ